MTIEGRWVGDETTIEGRTVSGGRVFTSPLAGTVDPDTQTIHLSYRYFYCGIEKYRMKADDCGEENATMELRKLE
jgi:hypothetical protein